MGVSQETRRTLLARIRELDDRDAWEEFASIYCPLIYGFCHKRGMQRADAADVAQDVMRDVARSIQRFEYDPERSSFRNWLFTLVRNRANKWVRKQARQPVGVGRTTIQGSLGRFGPYEILVEVAVGPMALVFKAYESALDRIVAVKALSPTLAQSESARERFLREARAMASIRHRNVIPVYAVDTEMGLPYLVMPFIDGPTLQARLTDGEALTLDEFLLVAEQLTAALVAAHDSGVIHRDIKPSNILLEEGLSHILLSDFGLARASEDKSVTRTGEIAGAPQFMSPEQARGEPVDQRTDLFSLGSVFYYLLVGRPPFDSDTALGAIRKVVEEDPEPIEKLRPGTPTEVVGWVQRLLSKDREKRFQSSGAVHKALVSYLRSKGSSKSADGGELPGIGIGGLRSMNISRIGFRREVLIGKLFTSECNNGQSAIIHLFDVR